jgi:uncharacterized membrane protein YqhA
MPDTDDTEADFGETWRSWVYKYLIREIVLGGSTLALLANALVMVGLFFAAALEGLVACLTFIGVRPPPQEFAAPGIASMVLGLKAVELALLAPLGYIFVSALTTFVQALVEDEGEEWTDPLRTVVAAKSLSVSLLISIAAVDFVGKILQEKNFEIANSLIEAMIIVILIGYLLVLEKSQHQVHTEHSQS